MDEYVMNAQAKRSLDQDPVVRTHEIRAKVKELNNVCEPVVTQPKPKIESPKLERTPNGPNIDKKEDLEGKIILVLKLRIRMVNATLMRRALSTWTWTRLCAGSLPHFMRCVCHSM